MRRNVTVSLDEETARWVRVEAARRDVSVSRFLTELLSERRRRTETYETARSVFMDRAPRPLRRAATPLPTREEIHHRARPRS